MIMGYSETYIPKTSEMFRRNSYVYKYLWPCENKTRRYKHPKQTPRTKEIEAVIKTFKESLVSTLFKPFHKIEKDAHYQTHSKEPL